MIILSRKLYSDGVIGERFTPGQNCNKSLFQKECSTNYFRLKLERADAVQTSRNLGETRDNEKVYNVQ